MLYRATEIKLENLGKPRTYLTSMSIPKQGKTNMNHNAWPAGTEESLRRNQNEQRRSVESHHMEHMISILLYDSFTVLPGSNQTFEEKQGHFKLPRARPAGRKEHVTYCVASDYMRNFKQKSKENSVTV